MKIEFREVSKLYGPVAAVKELNLTIENGALHFLLGPSGCGKTTTLRLLAGLEAPTAGQILFDDEDVTRRPASDRGIGMVFQNYALWPHMTVRKNIEYGLNLRKLSAAQKKSRLDKVVDITRLGAFLDRLPSQLSGGQQQRVALARALAIRPTVLLLDEPLSNLDAKLRLEMRDNISRIHRETGITTVYVTHDQKEALSMGTHISVMYSGSLIQSGTARDLYNDPASPFIAGFIGEVNNIEGVYRGRENGAFVIDSPIGRLLASRRSRSFTNGEKVVASVRPEAVKIKFNGESMPADNCFPMTLSGLTYLGEVEQFQFRGDDSRTIKAKVFNAPPHSLRGGDRVQCHMPPENILVLPGDELMGPGT